eukprot:159315-Rhodomonas_salina.1
MADGDTTPPTLLPKNFTTPFFFYRIPVCPLPSRSTPPSPRVSDPILKRQGASARAPPYPDPLGCPGT